MRGMTLGILMAAATTGVAGNVPRPTAPEVKASAAAPAAIPAEESRQIVEPRSPWLQEWPATRFGWRVGPIAGLKYTSEYAGEARAHDTSYETGVFAGARGLQFAPGNPGFTGQVDVGVAYGTTERFVESGDAFKSVGHETFRRVYGEVGGVWLWRFLREELTIGRGRKDFSDADRDPVQSAHVSSDTGVLMLSNWSQHYTIRLTRGYADRWGRPTLLDHDHWIHARVFAWSWNAYVDAGPGHSVTRIYRAAVGDRVDATLAEGQSEYLRATAGARVFWKLGAAAEAKYVYWTTESRLGEFSPPALPEESLSKVPTVAQPEDSLFASAFLGARDLWWGLGVGWRMNWLFYHMNERGGNDQVVVRDQGLALSFDKEF